LDRAMGIVGVVALLSRKTGLVDPRVVCSRIGTCVLASASRVGSSGRGI
jgi:hypothetical protein